MASFLIVLTAGTLIFGLTRMANSPLDRDMNPYKKITDLGPVRKGEIRERLKSQFVHELDGDTDDLMGAYFRQDVDKADYSTLSSNPRKLGRRGGIPDDINHFPVLI